MRCYFIPPHITARLPLPDRVADLDHDVSVRARRQGLGVLLATTQATINVFDAGHRQATASTTRATDVVAAQATAGLTAIDTLARTVGVSVSPMTAFVHYGLRYDNAFWDGQQMCFGDGDGTFLGDFTKPVDVCGHERWHGVTGDRLAYSGQAGALNESMSDVAGIVSKQKALGLGVTDPGAWLIGEGLLLERGFTARGLRDMLVPGSAYQTPGLGKDPQPLTMAGYVQTTDDDGGVHINSSIPNRAFALAAVELGAVTELFHLWVDVLLRANYATDCTFVQWAQLTVDRAPSTLVAAVVHAWTTVGVPVKAPASLPPATPPPTPAPAQGAPFPGASVDVAARLARVAARAGLTVAQYQERHWRSYFAL